MNDLTSFERRLSGLFDRQRFFHNPELDALAAETENRCVGGRALTDDELDLVSAAGESDPLWDETIRNETMPILSAEAGQGKRITRIIMTDDGSGHGRNDP